MDGEQTSMPMANMSKETGQLLEVISPKLWKDLTAEGESEMWWATPNEMREFLHRKIEKIYNLIRKLDELK